MHGGLRFGYAFETISIIRLLALGLHTVGEYDYDKVRYWGENLIALRDWKPSDIVGSDLSLRKEFDLDKPV